MNKLKTIFLLSLGLFILSCSNNDSSIDYSGIDFSKNFGGPVIKDFLGQVVDENNNPLVQTTVKIGEATVQTDINGVFKINAASVYSQFAYITAEKAGYINGSRAVVPSDGITNVRIMLFSDTTTSIVSAGTSSEVSLANGAKIVFSGGFKTDDDDIDYTGSVKVTVHYVDASDENLPYKMPGMMYGATTQKIPRILKTYGILNVDLRGTSGQKLKISNKANIKIPINTTQLNTAPSSLSFWSFDKKGYWAQEGSASIQSGFYVGDVSNVDWINSATDFANLVYRQSFINNEGNKLANVNIGILRVGEIFPILKTTNRDGQISSVIPGNEILTLNVYDNCGNIIKTSQIGPFAINTTSPNLTIGSDILPSINIIGNLYKCDNTVVTNGYVLIRSNNQTRLSSVPVTGLINLNTLICANGTSFSLRGGDFDNSQTTEYINYTHTAPITNVGHLKTCNTVREFISYKIDNGEAKFIVDTFNVNVSGSTIAISGSNTIGGLTMDLYGSASTIGIYNSNQFTIDNNSDTGTIDNSNGSTLLFNINQIGSSVGQYIDMTFIGSYMTGSTVHNITGVVHVKRD